MDVAAPFWIADIRTTFTSRTTGASSPCRASEAMYAAEATGGGASRRRREEHDFRPFRAHPASSRASGFVGRTQPCESDLLTLGGVGRTMNAIGFGADRPIQTDPTGLFGPGLISNSFFSLRP